METLTPKRRTRRKKQMARRLPRPAKPIRARCELSEDELKLVEDAAHACRLSVASFIRVALVADAANVAGRLEEWQRVAAELMKGEEPKPKKKPRGKEDKS